MRREDDILPMVELAAERDGRLKTIVTEAEEESDSESSR